MGLRQPDCCNVEENVSFSAACGGFPAFRPFLFRRTTKLTYVILGLRFFSVPSPSSSFSGAACCVRFSPGTGVMRGGTKGYASYVGWRSLFCVNRMDFGNSGGLPAAADATNAAALPVLPALSILLILLTLLVLLILLILLVMLVLPTLLILLILLILLHSRCC